MTQRHLARRTEVQGRERTRGDARGYLRRISQIEYRIAHYNSPFSTGNCMFQIFNLRFCFG
jgi:hypothetical protein